VIRNGRRTAIAVAAIGVLTIVLAAFFGRDRISEEWWLWKLSKPSSDEERIAAMDRLGELCSARAVPVILDLLQWRASDNFILSTPVTDSAMQALDRIGTRVKAQFLRGLDDSHFWVHAFSIAQLEKFGPEAKEAVPLLVALAKSKNVLDQRNSIKAIGIIAPHDEAIPILVGFLVGDETQQLAAARALGDIGPAANSALPRLKTLQENTMGGVLDEASRAIQKIEGRST
jgi:HEAT repeat protein